MYLKCLTAALVSYAVVFGVYAVSPHLCERHVLLSFGALVLIALSGVSCNVVANWNSWGRWWRFLLALVLLIPGLVMLLLNLFFTVWALAGGSPE